MNALSNKRLLRALFCALAVVAVSMVALAPRVAMAATAPFTVDGVDYSDTSSESALGRALDAAKSASSSHVVYVNDDYTLPANLNFNGKTLYSACTIKSSDSTAHTITLAAASSSSSFARPSTSLFTLTPDDANTTANSSLTIQNVNFTAQNASYRAVTLSGGGQYYHSRPTLVLDNANLTGFNAPSSGSSAGLGGTVYANEQNNEMAAHTEPDVLLEGTSTISNSTASQAGAGIYAANATTVAMQDSAAVSDCDINTTAANNNSRGAGVCLETSSSLTMSGSSSISDCTIARLNDTQDNNGQASGGAGVYMSGQSTTTMSGTSTVKDCRTNDATNIDMSGGGGFLINQSYLTMKGSSSIDGCESVWDDFSTTGAGRIAQAGSGGAIFFWGPNSASTDATASTFGATITDDATIQNCVTGYTGNIYAWGSPTITIEGSARVINNKAYGDLAAGAVFFNGYDDGSAHTSATPKLYLKDSACIAQNTAYSSFKTPGYFDNAQGSAICVRRTLGDVYIQDNAKVVNNEDGRTNADLINTHDHPACAIGLYDGGRLYMSGNGMVAYNKADSNMPFGGVWYWYNNLERRPQVHLQGSPTIDNNTNTNGTSRGIVMSDQTSGERQIIVDGALTGGHVGVTGSTLSGMAGVTTVKSNIDAHSQGAWFATVSSSYTPKDGDSFATLTNDDNPSLYGVLGSNSHVVWGPVGDSGGTSGSGTVEGTTQIIRNGTLVGKYPTLDYAMRDVQDGDTVEVYKSHATAGTVWVNKKNVTITQAPTAAEGASASGASTRDGDQVTVTRGSSVTNYPFMVVMPSSDDSTDADMDATVRGLVLDGGSVSSSASGIDVASHLHLDDVTVQHFVTTGDDQAAVKVEDGTENLSCPVDDPTCSACGVNEVIGSGVLYVRDKVVVSDGTRTSDSGSAKANVLLPVTSTATPSGCYVYLEGDAADSTFNESSIGVSVADEQARHTVYGVFAKTAPASASTSMKLTKDDANQFFDDLGALTTDVDDQTDGKHFTTSGDRASVARLSDGTSAGETVHFGDVTLRIQKNVEGDYADKSKTFDIKAVLTQLALSSANKVTVDYYDADGNLMATPEGADGPSSGDTAATASMTCPLASGEYVVVHGASPLALYQVSELNKPEGYTLTATVDGASVTVGADASLPQASLKASTDADLQTSVVLTNSFSTVPQTGVAAGGAFPWLLALIAAAAAGAGAVAYRRAKARQAAAAAAARHGMHARR